MEWFTIIYLRGLSIKHLKMNFANPTDGREVDCFSNYISTFKNDKIVSLIRREPFM